MEMKITIDVDPKTAEDCTGPKLRPSAAAAGKAVSMLHKKRKKQRTQFKVSVVANEVIHVKQNRRRDAKITYS